MFLHELNNTQRDAFLSLATRLMSADAELHDQELATITLMREEMDLPATWRPRSATTTELLSLFQSTRHRSIVIVELLRLANADQAVEQAESIFIREVVGHFGYRREQVVALARWFRRYTAVLAEGEALLGE